MPALARGQTSNCANPQLDVFLSVNGVLTDVYSLEFQIFELVTNPAVPTQVYPVAVGTRQAVNVGITCPTADAGRISAGRYFATWAVPLTELLGAHRIKWFFKVQSTSSEISFQEDFEVLAEGTATGESGYCLVADMRDEGVTEAQATDAFLLKRIALASRFIEATTRRYFMPRVLTFKLDGTGGPKLLLQDPIIAISTVKFETSPVDPGDFTNVDADILRVYNRHLSQGLIEPDDRNNPKIELFNPGFIRGANQTLSPLRFPVGQQNVEVAGVFGYTDPDTTNSQGKTPDLIVHACKLMVMRELAKIAKISQRFDAAVRHRLTSERTRDQSYNLTGLGNQMTGAFFTGDPAIDNILAYYQRPPAMGAT